MSRAKYVLLLTRAKKPSLLNKRTELISKCCNVTTTALPQQQTPRTVSPSTIGTTIGTTIVTQQTRGKNPNHTHISPTQHFSQKHHPKTFQVTSARSHHCRDFCASTPHFVQTGQLLLPYINSIFRYHSLIHSEEGLTLETSVFESFTVANLPYRPCV